MTFLQQLSQAILQRSDISLKDTLIVLPNKRARRMLQKELAASLAQPCFSPTIFSIDEFIRKLSDFTLCDDIDLLHILFKAYRQFEHAQSENLSAFLSWAETFIHDISEIDMQLADASKIFGNLSDIKELETVLGRENLTANQQRYLQFYATLYDLYCRFNSFLDEAKLAYEGKIYKNTAENILQYAQKLNFKRYIFAGFQTLSPSEMEIVRYYHQEHQAELYFDIDEFYRENYTPFIRSLQDKLKLKELEWIHTDYADIPKEINIIGAPMSMNQILYAIEQLNRIEKEEGNLNDTVLVLADEQLLTPFIHCYDCRKANLTMGYPLTATPAYALLAILIETALNGQRFQSLQQGDFLYYHRDVFSFFRNPLVVSYLFPNPQANKQFLDQLTALNSIFFTHQTLEFESYAFPDLSGNPIEVLEEIHRFLSLLSTKAEANTNEYFDYYCLNLLTDKLQQTLSNLRDFETKQMDFKSAVLMLNSLIQRLSIPLKGSSSEGLQIMGLLETRTLDFKNIIMLSVNEGTLPAGRSSNSLILHEVKKYFNLPTYQEKDSVYGYHFFRLLQRAQQVHLLYNTDSNTSLAEKSRFLKQLDFEVKAQHLSNITIHEKVLPTLVNTENSSSAISIRKDEAMIQQLRKKQYSYSHLNDYLNCPLQFYLKHIAHIEAADDISESVEQKIIGDAIHSILEEVGQQLIQQQTAYKQIILNHIKEIDTLVQDHIRQSILADRKTDSPQLKPENFHIDLEHGKTYLATEVVKKAVKTYLASWLNDYEQAEKKQQTFKLLATEQKMTCTVDVDQQTLQLKGYADRIDLRNGRVTLLDYKTGRVDAEGLKYKQFSDIFSGTKHKQLLQLLMYAYLYDKGQGSGVSDQETVKGIRNSREPEPVTYNLSPETCNLKPETYNYACGIISFQQLYQNKPHEIYPTFHNTNDSSTETGNLQPETSTDLITPAILKLFETHLINLLSDIVNPGLPFCQTDDVDHCHYCDYSAICKRQSTQDE